MRVPEPQPLLQNRLDIHDRKQFELKLEYQPSGRDPKSKYVVDMFMFVPASLNVDSETYPRQDFYADIHNYIRFKTPVMELEDLLAAESSPLCRLERALTASPLPPESDLIYDAKLLSCAFRGAMRRFQSQVDRPADALCDDASDGGAHRVLDKSIREVMGGVSKMMTRFRAAIEQLFNRRGLEERTRAAFRLVDEYLSLSIEQFFRKAVAEMDALPRSGPYVELRKELMSAVVEEEGYRRRAQLKSVLSPAGDNEEYMQRLGFLKKYCMNILFLSADRKLRNTGWEEMLLAVAAGLAMAFATAMGLFVNNRFLQGSVNFFLVAIVGYMMKDRIKEGLRRLLTRYAARRLFDRTTHVSDPVTKNPVALCKEKVDYGSAVRVPPEILKLRQTDDIAVVSQGEVPEMVIRYQKLIVLNSDALPRLADAPAGVTDIIRINVERLLRDMDDPDHGLEYVDLEHLSVGRIKAAKAYQVDLAFRFAVDDADQNTASLQMVRLVLDRNGIKRMHRSEATVVAPAGAPVRSVA